jgi:hypothetical protein
MDIEIGASAQTMLMEYLIGHITDQGLLEDPFGNYGPSRTQTWHSSIEKGFSRRSGL